MQKPYVFLIILFLLFSVSHAQVQRIVLLEEATNASCGPCATYNPILQKFYTSHFGGVVSVRYHAWWPGSNDPMYLSAADDCRTRIGYYGINAVPTYVLDGHTYGVPSDYQAMVTRLNERLQVPSPIKINIHSRFTDDSVFAAVQLIPVQEISAQSLYLRVAITQRMVSYPSPPGSNGEKDFPEVLRKMLPNATGTAITGLTLGDTLNFEFSTPAKGEWEMGDLAVVAWLQSDANKEVLQANIDFPTFQLQHQNAELNFSKANTVNHFAFSVFNRNDTTIHVQLKFNNVQKPSGWDNWFETEDGQKIDEAISILAGDTLHFVALIQSGEFGSLNAQIFVENLDDPGFYGEGYGYGYGADLTVVVPENSDILFVDDDGGASYEKNFFQILDKMKVRYIALDEPNALKLSQQFDLNQYSLILWNVSWGFPAFTPDDINLLTNYLDKGGNLAIFGQDIGWDIFDSQGNSHFQKAMDFIHNYFDVKYVSDNSKGTSFVGVTGDPIGDGLSFDLARPYGFANFFPEELNTYSGKSQAIFKYNNGKIGALRYDSGTFKTVYFGIGFEQIATASARDSVLTRILNWTANITNLPHPSGEHPRSFVLLNHYPNPFNNSLILTFVLPNTLPVEISIFNSAGQKIKTWKGIYPAGKHQIRWTATNQNQQVLASGVYYLRFTAGKTTIVRKLVLVR